MVGTPQHLRKSPSQRSQACSINVVTPIMTETTPNLASSVHQSPERSKANKRAIKGKGGSTVTQQRVGSARLETISSVDEIANKISMGLAADNKDGKSSSNLLMNISTFEALNRGSKPVAAPVTSHEERQADKQDQVNY